MRWIRPTPAAKPMKTQVANVAPIKTQIAPAPVIKPMKTPIAAPKAAGAAIGSKPGVGGPSMSRPAVAAMAPVARQKGISKQPKAPATKEVSHPQSHAAFMKLGAD